MEQKQISITVPMDYLALTRVSDMLHGLAQDVAKEIDTPIETTPASVVAKSISPDAAEGINVPTQEHVAPQNTVPPVKKGIPRVDKPDPKSLDADGVPWDGRIHGKSQTRLTRGDTWTLIRGIEKKSPGLVEQVKAELLATQTAVTGQPVIADAATPAAQAFGTQEPATVATVTPITLDFAGLMSKITPRLAADPNYNHTIQAVLAELNVTGLPALLQQTDLIPQVDARLDALWQG